MSIQLLEGIYIFMEKFKVNLRYKLDKYIKLNGISYEYFVKNNNLHSEDLIVNELF